jgi:hypothetical protein
MTRLRYQDTATGQDYILPHVEMGTQVGRVRCPAQQPASA